MSSDHQQFLLRMLLSRRSQVLAYLWSIVRDHHMAEDLFQAVSIITTEKSPPVKNEQEFMRWVLRTARYEALAALRLKKKDAVVFNSSVLDLLDADWEAVEARADDDVSMALEQCLERLSPRSRMIVQLKYVDGLRGQEIAEKLSRKLNAVYVAIARIHRQLSECVEKALHRKKGYDNG